MAECQACGKKVSSWLSDKVNGKTLCAKCADEERRMPSVSDIQNGLTEKGSRLSEILTLSIDHVPGKQIARCYDIIAAEVVLGTGMGSEFEAAISDTLGTSSNSFEEKAGKARQIALAKLKFKADKVGANAIIGVNVQYFMNGKDMFLVSASGTPVLYN